MLRQRCCGGLPNCVCVAQIDINRVVRKAYIGIIPFLFITTVLTPCLHGCPSAALWLLLYDSYQIMALQRLFETANMPCVGTGIILRFFPSCDDFDTDPHRLLCSQTLTYIDRSNVSFASLQFRGDLGLTAGEYGLGAGIFYIGYAAFQVFLNSQTGGLGLSHDSAQESGVLGHCGPPSPYRRPV